MEMTNPALVEPLAQVDGYRRGDERAWAGAFVEPFEGVLEPLGNLGVSRHAADRLEAGDRHDPWQDRGGNAGGQCLVEKAEIGVGREEELGNRLIGAGIELALQVVEVGLCAQRLGWISG
jgi:hypothetical protein